MRDEGCSCGAYLILFLLAVAVIIGIGYAGERMAVDHVTGTVTDKYIKRYGDDRFHVVVKLDDGTTEIFQNHDALWWGKWNSADVQQAIELNKKYRFTVYGWRIPLMSAFRNIVEYTPTN